MTPDTRAASQKTFERDRLTWFCYIMMATYCYTSAALGPLMTFVRAELHLNYTMTALHFSIWSCGNLVAGFTGDKCMRRFGKCRTIWASCASLCVGLLLIACAHDPLATLAGAFLCGISGNTMNQTIFTILADKFLELRAVAITEANIGASLLCSLAPLAVGKLSQTSLHWQAALILPVVCFFLYFIVGRKALDPVTEPIAASKQLVSGKLPRAYWIYWSLIFLSVACEWSIIYWSADFMESVAKLAKSNAAASVTFFLAAMVIGRIVGSRLAREVKSRTLLKVASVVALSGFLLFWLNTLPALCQLGLFIAGIGISNFYPLTYAMAIGSAPGMTSKAAARISLSTGGSVLLTPLLLGVLAQHTGIFAAYGLIAVLLCFCCLMVCLPIWPDPSKT